MSQKSPGHYVTGFGVNEWTDRPLKDSGSMFLGSGFLTFLVCLLLMIFIPPLRDFAVYTTICTLVAILVMTATIVGNVRRDRACMQRMVEQTNAFMVETTGNPNARITAGGLRALIHDNRRSVALQINGVPGVEIKAMPKDDQATQILAILTPPDFGLRSFDVLLKAEEGQKP